MFTTFYTNALAYFSAHPLLNSIAHAAGGFGLAIVLQQYLVGFPFVSVWVGWAGIIFSISIHVRAFTRR
jgi:hypothetical protein